MTGLVKSPCIRVCKINKKSNCCMGCGRSIDQITNWINYDQEKRRMIIYLIKNNLRKKFK